MKITLNKPKKIIKQPEISEIVSELNVMRVVDLPQAKIVRCFIENFPRFLILWEGAEYDSIGQWTDEDVRARILELI